MFDGQPCCRAGEIEILVIVILDGGRMFLTMPIVARNAALRSDVVVTFVAALLSVVRVHVSHRT